MKRNPKRVKLTENLDADVYADPFNYCFTPTQMTAPFNNWKSLAPHILVVALLLWALIPTNPYGYYSVMRWIVCASFIYFAVRSHKQHLQTWVWV